MTLSPFDINSSKIALPIPSLAPVIRAVLFNKGFMLKICADCKNHEREKRENIAHTEKRAESFCIPIRVYDTSLYH